MTVRVKLFAIAKERAGREELTLELPNASTIADAREAIAAIHPELNTILQHSMWAVDAAYANDKTVLTERSEVALIPPVSGG